MAWIELKLHLRYCNHLFVHGTKLSWQDIHENRIVNFPQLQCLVGNFILFIHHEMIEMIHYITRVTASEVWLTIKLLINGHFGTN